MSNGLLLMSVESARQLINPGLPVETNSGPRSCASSSESGNECDLPQSIYEKPNEDETSVSRVGLHFLRHSSMIIVAGLLKSKNL